MPKYQVIVHARLDQLLDDIRNRMNPAYQKWPRKEFMCRSSAERYAFLATMATGRNCSVSEINLAQQNRLITRLDKIFGSE